MAKLDLTKISATSLLPGFENIGTSTSTLSVIGTIANQANLTGSGSIYFPRNDVMALIRVNLPDAGGDLATNWFPVIGTIQLYDNSVAGHKYYLTLYTQPAPQGRSVTFDFTSDEAANSTTFNGYRINLAAHIYSYPFSNPS